MADVTISQRDKGGHGTYYAHVEGSQTPGRLTWTEQNGTRTAEKTIVPPEIGGRGIAAQLVEALVADAREHGFQAQTQRYVHRRERRGAGTEGIVGGIARRARKVRA